MWICLLKTKWCIGNSLVVLWLRLGAFTAVEPGTIPGWGTKIPQATLHGQKEKWYITGWPKRKLMHNWHVIFCKIQVYSVLTWYNVILYIAMWLSNTSIKFHTISFFFLVMGVIIKIQSLSKFEVSSMGCLQSLYSGLALQDLFMY